MQLYICHGFAPTASMSDLIRSFSILLRKRVTVLNRGTRESQAKYSRIRCFTSSTPSSATRERMSMICERTDASSEVLNREGRASGGTR